MPIQFSGAARISAEDRHQAQVMAKAFAQLFALASSDYTSYTPTSEQLFEDRIAYIAFQAAIAITQQPYSSGYDASPSNPGQRRWMGIFQVAYQFLANQYGA